MGWEVEITLAENTIIGFRLDSHEEILSGTVKNWGVRLTTYPDVSLKGGQGLAYLSSDRNELSIMAVNGTNHSIMTLKRRV